METCRDMMLENGLGIDVSVFEPLISARYEKELEEQ